MQYTHPNWLQNLKLLASNPNVEGTHKILCNNRLKTICYSFSYSNPVRTGGYNISIPSCLKMSKAIWEIINTLRLHLVEKMTLVTRWRQSDMQIHFTPSKLLQTAFFMFFAQSYFYYYWQTEQLKLNTDYTYSSSDTISKSIHVNIIFLFRLTKVCRTQEEGNNPLKIIRLKLGSILKIG